MAKRSDIKSSALQEIQNYIAEGERISLWEQALTGLQSMYRPQISAVQQSSAYDISQAYANYKKSQLNLMQNQQLGTGLKEQISSGLGQQYQLAQQQAKTTESQQLLSLASAYAEDVKTLEEQFTQEAETTTRILEGTLAYINELKGTNYTLDAFTNPQLGFVDAEGNWTEKGIALLDEAYGNKITQYNPETGEILIDEKTGEPMISFGDWLGTQKDFADLQEIYGKNPSFYANVLGGKAIADLEISADEANYRQKVINLGGAPKEGETYEQAYDRLVFGKSENINNIKNVLREMEVYQVADKSHLRDELSVKKSLSNELGISENTIKTYGYYDNDVSRTQQLFVIDIDTKNLTNAQKTMLKESGFVETDNKMRYSLLPNTQSTLDEYFAR